MHVTDFLTTFNNELKRMLLMLHFETCTENPQGENEML